MRHSAVIAELEKLADPAKAKVLAGFFKTGPGQYGEGDVFWGVTVPKARRVAAMFRELPLAEVQRLLRHPVHEVRLCGLLVLVGRYPKDPDNVYSFYMANRTHVNNWDLVDLTAPNIVGAYLADRDRSPLFELARAKRLWDRRIAIVATFHFIRRGESTDTFAIAERLMDDTHDLMHKATGWMLRELGKRGGEDMLCAFLDKNAARMPRTMLRYAIERFAPEKKARYMAAGRR